MLEIALKIVVTLVLLIPLAGSLYGITWLWRADVDLAKTFSLSRVTKKIEEATPPFIVTRDPSIIYQDGEPFGTVVSFNVDEAAGTIVFHRIVNVLNGTFNKRSEFRKYVFDWGYVDGMSGNEPGKLIITEANAKIVSTR